MAMTADGGDAECAQELRALKQQLQATIDRMGSVRSASSQSGAATGENAAAGEAKDGKEEEDALEVLRELTRIARRRGHLGSDGVAGIRRDGASNEQSGDPPRQRGKRSLRRAIEKLRRQREEIKRQIESDTAADRGGGGGFGGGVMKSKTDYAPVYLMEPLQPGRNGNAMSDATVESQYSIGGIVTLEPLLSNEKALANLARIPVHHPAPVHTAFAPRVVYPKTLDALNDVFSIQLKFAETMQQLEESVQARDQLLNRPLPRRIHRRHHHHRKPKVVDADQSMNSANVSSNFESDSNSSSSSDDDDLVSSGASTIVGLTRRYSHQRYRRESVETSQHASTPSSSDDTARHASSINSMAVTASVSANTSPSVFQSSHASSPDHETPPHVRRQENADASSAVHVTPSTGSSKKSEASLSKQVHFGSKDFSTPQITRKFSFGSSDDDDDDDDDVRPHFIRDIDDSVADMSGLSLLEGSSVHSSELNGESFLLAFEQFRHEVKGDLPAASTFAAGSSSSNAARALFTTPGGFVTPEKVKPGSLRLQACEDDLHGRPEVVATIEKTRAPTSDVDVAAPNASREELQELRRQLCLDVQAESAMLALAFASDERQVDATKSRLLALRSQLDAVEAQLAAVA